MVRVRCPHQGEGTVIAVTDRGDQALVVFDNITNKDGVSRPNNGEHQCWRSLHSEYITILKEKTP